MPNVLEPRGGFKGGQFVLGALVLPEVTRFGSNMLAIPNGPLKMISQSGVDRLATKGPVAALSVVLHLWQRTSFTLGWAFGEVADALGMANDRVSLSIAEGAKALPAPKQPAAQGIVGRRFNQEAGGIVGAKFGQETGGVMGRKFGQDAGQAESEGEILRRLQQRLEVGGMAFEGSESHVTVRRR